MDHFESIVHTILEFEGYWVRSSYKVELTKTEKASTGKHSIPRPEIDLLAFHAKKNELLVLEVKSYLDSPGVKLADIEKTHNIAQGRYKLFTSLRYRSIVISRLKEQLIEAGAIKTNTKIILGLVAGKVYGGNSASLKNHMDKINCRFYSPETIKDMVQGLAKRGYENNAASITAKILLNGRKSGATCVAAK